MNRVEPSMAAIFRDQRMTEPDVRPFIGGQVGVFSTRSPDKDSANEDAAAVVAFDEGSGALIVADGMGGHAAGEIAAQTAIEQMIAAIDEVRSAGALLRTGIINGFERANRAVQSLSSGAGTTLAVVELSEGLARPYHAGDSVILIVGARGKIKLETTCHSPVGFGVEAGLIDAEQAMDHEHRHLVLNAIGSESMRIEIGSPVRLAQRDTVLLASDGLTDNLTVHQVADRIRVGALAASLAALVGACQARMKATTGPGKPDDLTAIVFRNRAATSPA